MAARVDVLMPAYNAAATVADAIASLLTQTVQDIRVIVVDDGSTDATREILAELARKDSRLFIIAKANAGIVEARNDSIRHADAEFIACLDADDIASPDRFERQLAYMAANPNCVGVGGKVEHIDERGARIEGMLQPGPPSEADPNKAPALEPYIMHSTLMARRAPAAALGYRHVPNSEDSDLFWRLAELGDLVNLPDIFGRYRVHTASVSSSLVNGRIMAAGSQLGALSALRRRAGRPDLHFTRQLHEDLKAAWTLDAIVERAGAELDADERVRLRIATACKFMELARYRPFEPEVEDCTFVRGALPLASTLTRMNQREVSWLMTNMAARLIRKGKYGEAFALTPPMSYPIAAARVLFPR